MNKQKLQEQIDTMREELAKMETELAECEKVELKEGYSFHCDGQLSAWSKSDGYINAGATRQTTKLAEIASKNMVTRNKLEAYAHQIDPDWRDKDGYTAYSIYRRIKDNTYVADPFSFGRQVGAVYMSKSTAEQICEWLNDGRIEL